MALLIKNARLFGVENLVDIEVQENRISQLGQKLPEKDHTLIQADGRLIVPGFADIHTHMDKAYTAGRIKNTSGTLSEAIAQFNAIAPTFDEEDYYQRGKQLLDTALSHGTLYVRTHATISKELGLRALRVAVLLKKEYQSRLTLQVVAFPAGNPENLDEQVLALSRQALMEGADLMGGTPNRWPNQKQAIDGFFRLAQEMDVDIDLHIDEQDKPCALGLSYLAQKTAACGWQGRVSAGHCCSLSSLPRETADTLISTVRDSGVSVVALPSCNLYLMGRGDEGIVRRGTTRIRELLEAGVNLSIASDNVRDVFRPFGNANLLEELLMAAQITRMDQPSHFEQLLRAGTYNPAKAMGIQSYGISQGAPANLVLLQDKTPQQAILNQAGVAQVIYEGNVLS